jgi:hypothetical protein
MTRLLTLANDTTFDLNGDLTCVWMDQHYNWNDATFKNRSGESLNLAVNAVADVLHTFSAEGVVIPEFPPTFILAMLLFLALPVVFFVKRKKVLWHFPFFGSKLSRR